MTGFNKCYKLWDPWIPSNLLSPASLSISSIECTKNAPFCGIPYIFVNGAKFVFKNPQARPETNKSIFVIFFVLFFLVFPLIACWYELSFGWNDLEIFWCKFCKEKKNYDEKIQGFSPRYLVYHIYVVFSFSFVPLL